MLETQTRTHLLPVPVPPPSPPPPPLPPRQPPSDVLNGQAPNPPTGGGGVSFGQSNPPSTTTGGTICVPVYDGLVQTGTRCYTGVLVT